MTAFLFDSGYFQCSIGYSYYLKKISGNRRIFVRILQIMSLFITYFCGLLILLMFSAFDINTAKHFSVFILFEYLLVPSIAY